MMTGTNGVIFPVIGSQMSERYMVLTATMIFCMILHLSRRVSRYIFYHVFGGLLWLQFL